MKSAARVPIAVFFFLLSLSAAASVGPYTTKNDDSCDVMLAPAATLLLPYFEVDVSNPTGATTIFTVANVTALPQIAHVTIWTDLAFPVVDFDIFLTGYDAQSINLYDVLARGRIAEPGTTSDAEVGPRSRDNTENPLLDVTNCDNLVVIIPKPILSDMQSALVQGRSSRCDGTNRVGGIHTNAVGYITIDVVASCTSKFPTDADYATTLLLYDNVLTGDYQQVTSSQNFAQGGPMVHIRAFPEGGAPGAKPTNLTRTFYGQYQNGGTADRRQPLPATFAARWIAGGAAGFNTSFRIWRQGLTRSDSGCAVGSNSTIPVAEVVRFDEEENPTTLDFDCPILCPPFPRPWLPVTSRTAASDTTVFPPNFDGAVAGWMYLNLDNGSVETPVDAASQNWVTTSMDAERRYSTDIDAAAFGNGCSALTAKTDENRGTPAIGPAPNAVKTFATGSPATLNNDDSCDIMIAPAATLLLPYFEVDLSSPTGETTLFTITNVTANPQIAHVTLWTDWSYPVLSFDVFLTGYDVQAINLYDVIGRGVIAPPGTSSRASVGRRSARNDGNPLLDIRDCDSLPTAIPAGFLAELQVALTAGRVPGCDSVGGKHANAIGHVTVDVVNRCGVTLPTDGSYFTQAILFDNVLIGDYQQVNSAQNFARGNPMVHIRAIPEGGTVGTSSTNFARTFYSQYQNGGTADRRQPLPSTFAAHWISGGATGFETSFKIWREGVTRSAACGLPNSRIDLIEFVRFDERENPTTANESLADPPGSQKPRLPTTVRLEAADGMFLPPVYDDTTVAGWMYVNLDSVEALQGAASQSWVVVSMAAEGRYSVDFDALSLGNGCSAAVGVTDDQLGPPAIGPASNP